MTLAWIVDGVVRCCSDLCGDCDKREEHGCVPVEVREKSLPEEDKL